LVKIFFATQTRGCFGVAHACTRWFVVGTPNTIRFTWFTLFVQIGIRIAFFARRFAFAVLVVTGGTGRTFSFGTAIRS
jgi:hypothetical protein